jgi:hypothetical protein
MTPEQAQRERDRDRLRYKETAGRKEALRAAYLRWRERNPPSDPIERLKHRSCLMNWRDCPTCQKRFIARPSHKAYCSQACCPSHLPQTAEPRHLDCPQCGCAFNTIHPSKKFCSTKCAKAYMRKARKHKLRAARSSDEWISIRIVGNRDGWRCHICKRKVARKDASLDHLNPLSDKQNGTHSLLNVAIAHHRCNTLRRDKGPAQLRLIA